MTIFFVCNDISNATLDTATALNNIADSIFANNVKPNFIYAYSIFESTITEILRYYLRAFPNKIDKNITVDKDLVTSAPRTSKLLDSMIDQNIRRYSCKSLYKYILFFQATQDLDFPIDADIINRISNLRNSIVHDDFRNSLIYKHTKNTKTINEKIPLETFKSYIQYLVQILHTYIEHLQRKYSEYTLDRLARSIWKNTFPTPLLPFDVVWEYNSEGYLQFKDIDDLKERAYNLCNSEHLLLSIFLQQYNRTSNNYVHSWEKIPSLVSIDDENKDRLVELIDFFDSFPLIFCGQVLK